MAILVTLDVDDNGTVKIENAVDALSRLGATYTREGKKIADAGNEVAKSQKGQADALNALVQNSGAAQSATIRQAQAFSVLSKELKSGGTVTQLQANALSTLSTQLQGSTLLTGRQQSALANLVSTMQVGNTVTSQQAAQLQGLANAHQASAAAALNHSNTLDSLRLGLAAVSAALTLVAAGAYEFLKETASLAARVETLGVVMTISAKNASLSSQEMRVQVESTKKLGITTQEAENSVIQFVQANLKLSDASKVARVAQDLAVVAGKNSSQAFETLTAAIQIQQPMLLRQFGIVANLDKVYADYALSVGKTVTQLDGLDKKQAFVNLILKEGEKFTGAYEAAMGTAGKQVTSLARYVEEAKLKLGDGLLPLFSTIIKGATDALIWVAKLPPETLNLAAALMAGVAAASLLLGLLAAARWIGIIKVIVDLGSAFKALAVAMAAGSWTEMMAAVNPWIAAATILAAVIGAVTAAYVYFSKQQEINVDRHIQAAAALEAEQRAQDKALKTIQDAQEPLSRLHEQYDALSARTNRSADENERLSIITRQLEAEQAKYGRAVNDLTKIVPGAIVAITGESIAYDTLTGAINKANEARKKDMADQLWMAKQQLDRAKAVYAEEAKRRDDLRAQIEATEKKLQDTKSGRAVTEQVLAGANKMGPVYDTQTISASTLETRLKNLKEQVAPVIEALKEAQGSIARYQPEVDALELSTDPARQRTYNTGVVREKVDQWKAINKDWQDQLKNAGKTDTALYGLDDPKKLEEAMTLIENKWQEHRKKLEAEQKKITSTMEQIGEQAAKHTPQMRAQMQEFDKLFGAAYANGDVEETTRLLKLFGGQMEKLGSPTELAAKGFTNLARASQQWKDQKLDDYARGLNKEMESALTAIREHGTTMTEGLWSGVQQQVDDANTRMIESEQAVTDKVSAMDTDLYEKQVVSRMNATDQAIYQEHKRVAEIAKAVELEIEVRNRGFEKMRSEADAKAVMAQKEMDDLIRKATLQRDLKEAELQAELAVARVRQDPDAVRLLEGQLAAYQQVTAEFKKRAEVVKTAAYSEVEFWRQNQHEIIDIEQAKSDQLAAMQRGAVDREKAYSAEATTEIIRDNSAIYQSLKSVSDMLLTGFENSFAQVISGAQSLKEALTGIWNSLKQTLLGAITEMATGWMKLLALPGPGQAPGATGPRPAFSLMSAGGMAVPMLMGSAGVAGASGWGVQGPGTYSPDVEAGGRGGVSAGWGMALQNWKNAGSNLKTLFTKGTSGFGATPGMFGGAGVGSSTGMLGYVGGSAVGGAVGYGVGNWVGSSTGSKTWGGLSGAASGALTGFAMGGPIGAAIGGVAGLIGGLLSASKAQKQIADTRAEFIKLNGGIEALTKAAGDGGVSLQKMLTTTNPKEFAAELAKIDNGLKSHKLITDFEAINGGADELAKKAAAAGVALDDLYRGGQKADDYAAAIDRITKALDLQKAKDGIATTVNQMDDLRKKAVLVGYDLSQLYNATTIEAFNGQQAILNDLLAKQQSRLDGLTMAASGVTQRTKGLVGSVTKGLESVFGTDEAGAKAMQDFFDQYAEAKGAHGYTGSLTDFAKQQHLVNQEKLPEVLKTAQEGFTALGAAATATFAGILRETGDLNQAMAAIADPLDQLIGLEDKLGITADAGLQSLLDLRKTITVNQDVADSLSGITSIIKGLSDGGALTADTFNAMGDDAAAMYDTLQSRGVSADQTMLMMQPTLQALWEAQKNFGFVTDESTQKLIDMGVANGTVGDQFQSVNQKMLDMLVIIAEVLGADIPEAYRKQTEAAGGAVGQQIDDLQRLKQEADAARQAMNDTTYVGRVTRADQGLDAPVGGSGGAPSNSPADAPAPTVVNVTGPSSSNQFTIHALDGADVERIMNEQILPQLVAAAQTNDGQFTSQLEDALTRYRR